VSPTLRVTRWARSGRATAAVPSPNGSASGQASVELVALLPLAALIALAIGQLLAAGSARELAGNAAEAGAAALLQGTDPTAADKATIDHQIQSGEIKVYVYNSQNATPDIQRQIEEARNARVPIATITETLVPAGASFQAWQVRELQTLAAALARATGR